MKSLIFSACFACALLLAVSSRAFGEAKRALLIGINTYTPDEGANNSEGHSSIPIQPADKQSHAPDSRFGGAATWPNLEGPETDVDSMAAVLPNLGFTEIHQLKGQKATREATLAEIDKYVVTEPKAGDTVLFYFAGHGSQRFNSKSSKLDHLDETIVPADAYKGTFDIRDKELARKFNQAIDKGVHVIAIFDSCHSGTMARGVKVGRARWLAYDDRDAADAADYGIAGTAQPDPPAKRGAIIISAALSTQTADEVADEKGNAHGVFTDAFIRAVRSSTPAWSTLDLVNSTDALLKADGWPQQPSVEGPSNRPLFGDFTVSGIRATVLKILPPDQVVLNAGSAAGIGPGSQFENQAKSGVKLEIIEVTNPASSRAKVTSGKLEDIKAGDLFQITRLALAPEAKLTVFVPGIVSEEEWARISNQLKNLKGDGWSLAQDPLELPSNLVYWTSAGWTMTSPQGGSANLGPALTAAAISKVVHRGAKVYVSVPPTRKLIDALKEQSGISSGAIDLSGSLLASQYILVGRPVAGGGETNAEYALALPGLFGAFDPATIVKSQDEAKTVVCSTESEMPLRTDWVRHDTRAADGSAAAASEIEAAALKLGRDRAWLRTGANNGDTSWPYRLAIAPSASGQPDSESAPLSAGSEYDVTLVADPAELASHAVLPRYVYLFGLQCDGSGQLLYPSAELGGGAPLPLLTEGEHGRRYPEKIKLEHLQVAPPLGRDTIVLLATRDRISDLSAFNYSGVVTQGTRGVGNQLDDLVRSISGQSRGMASVSTTWSIQRTTVRSR
jgi:uncharacterized caspase-like protein